MSSTTVNYSLVKQDPTELVDVSVYNGDLDLLDGIIKTANDKLTRGGDLPYWIATTSATTSVPNTGVDTVIKNWVTATALLGLGTSDVAANEFSYNNTTGELTIKKAGVYSFSAFGTSAGDTGGSRVLEFKQNGNLIMQNRTMPIDASTCRLIPLVGDVVCAANDLITVVMQNGSTAASLACFATGSFSRWSVMAKRLF